MDASADALNSRDAPPGARIALVDAAAVRPVRIAVLRDGRAGETGIWPGDDDPATFHFGAHIGREIVGVASFMPAMLDGHAAGLPALLGREPSGVYKLRGMAVLPQHQRRGIGDALIAAALGELRARDCNLLWCHARCTARGFYACLGFAEHGEIWDTDHGPHIVMWRWV